MPAPPRSRSGSADLSGKVAVVTGSTHGIGRAIGIRLASLGAAVVINGHRSDGTPVVKEVEERGGKAIFLAADVSDSTQVEKLIQGAVDTLGSVDILVNNAGITRDNLLLRLSDAEWDQVLNVNLKGAFLCTRAALKHMLRKRWGRIVNITSVVGIMGNAGQSNYAAAKAGLIGLTRSLAKEVASRSITVNAVAPGLIDTDMTAKLSEHIKKQVLGRVPLGAFGTPDDVASAVAFLASEEARYITGHVLSVDGGLGMF